MVRDHAELEQNTSKRPSHVAVFGAQFLRLSACEQTRAPKLDRSVVAVVPCSMKPRQDRQIERADALARATGDPISCGQFILDPPRFHCVLEALREMKCADRQRWAREMQKPQEVARHMS
jgi:hypothetical protein